MLNSLVISSSSNAVKYSGLFRALGTEVSYIILDHGKGVSFSPFNEHRMYANGLMHYVNMDKNTLDSHKLNYQKTQTFTQTLQNYFLADIPSKRSSFFTISPNLSTEPVNFYEKEDVLDLKDNKNLRNIQLEIQNKGLVNFDHLFVEETDSCLEFLIKKSTGLIETVDKSDLIWCCYNYRLSAHFSNEDFWYVENANYLSLFDNCFYLQPNSHKLAVWCLIPGHQFLNQQFHQDFQKRVKLKIESQFSFVSLSFIEVMDSSIHLMKSQKLKIKDNSLISGFPSFSFYSNDEVQTWFGQHLKEFNKKHKIKNASNEVLS